MIGPLFILSLSLFHCRVFLLLICKPSLFYIQQTGQFMRRTYFKQTYKLAILCLAISVGIFIFWLIVTVACYFSTCQIYLFTQHIELWLKMLIYKEQLINFSIIMATIGFILGAILDYLAIRKTEIPKQCNNNL